MKKYVVLDLEMCKIPRSRRTKEFHWATETIQIGAVLLNEEFEIVDEFNTFVAPRYGYLTSEIKKLTGIHEGNLREAPDIEEAFKKLTDWLPSEYAFVAWSDSDRAQFQYEIFGKHLEDYEFLLEAEWIDCQKIFSEKVDNMRHYKLVDALNIADIEYRKGMHNGLVDAYNTALLFAKMVSSPEFRVNKYYQKMLDSGDVTEHLYSSLEGIMAQLNLSSVVA